MESNILKKKKEKVAQKPNVKPITMCQIFFKEGYTVNNSKILKKENSDFILGKELNFIEVAGIVYARFKNNNTWTVYQNGEYARIVKTN